MNSNVLVPAILFLLSLVIRCVYELLKEKGKINLENKPIFVVIFSVMGILWISWFTLCPADPIKLHLADSVRWIALAVVLLGTLLAVGALIQLRGVENITHLVTTGLFKKIRHPMYAGFISWLLGWSMYHDGAVSFGIGIIGIACVLWWRHLEERRLEIQFGESYRNYRLTTWF